MASLARNRSAARVVGSVQTALIYTRVSTDDQAREGLSLEAQLAACRRYSAERGWVLGDEYQDVMTGRRDDRPRYQALLGDVRRFRADGRHVVVVVMALDRFGRRILERVRSREELKRLGVPVHSIREGGEVSDLVANILASVAEDESQRLGVRVREVRERVVENGWRPIGEAPWGYRWRDATDEERASGAPQKVPDYDPQTEPFVREFFARAKAGASSYALARWAAGLPNGARGGRSLGPAAVRYLMVAPVYVGRPDGPREVSVLERRGGKWPRYVEDDDWTAIQARLRMHSRMPRQATGRFLLTGLIRCPACGSRMVGAASPGRAVRYLCNSRAQGAKARKCLATVLARQVEERVVEEVAALADVLTAPGEVRRKLERAWAILRRPPADEGRSEQRRRWLESETERAQKRLADAAIKLVDGDIDKAGYDAAKARIEADLRAAEGELAGMARPARVPELPPLPVVLRKAGTWAEVMRDPEGAEARDVLGELVDCVAGVREGYGRYGVAITWTPLGAGLLAASGRPATADRAA